MNGFLQFNLPVAPVKKQNNFPLYSLFWFVFVLFYVNPAFSQGQKISNINAANPEYFASECNALILCGYNCGAIVIETDNNGFDRKDPANIFPDNVSDVNIFNDALYAAWLDGIFISTDNGKSWHLKATMTFNGDGALMTMTSDGEVMYA